MDNILFSSLPSCYTVCWNLRFPGGFVFQFDLPHDRFEKWIMNHKKSIVKCHAPKIAPKLVEPRPSKTLGQMNRGILVSCGNQYCTVKWVQLINSSYMTSIWINTLFVHLLGVCDGLCWTLFVFPVRYCAFLCIRYASGLAFFGHYSSITYDPVH